MTIPKPSLIALAALLPVLTPAGELLGQDAGVPAEDIQVALQNAIVGGLASTECPMPVHVPDVSAVVAMPTLSAVASGEYRMPVAKPRCTNPLGPATAGKLPDGKSYVPGDRRFKLPLARHPSSGADATDPLRSYLRAVRPLLKRASGSGDSGGR